MQNHCFCLLCCSSYSVEWLAKSTGFLTISLDEHDQFACCSSIANHRRYDGKLVRGDRRHGDTSLYHRTNYLVALFITITHMLIVEGMTQHKSGLNVIKVSLVRIGAAVLFVFVTYQFFADTSQNISLPANLATYKLK